MDPKSAAQAYRHSLIEHAPPLKIVRLLYEGALRHLDRAAAGIAEQRDGATENLARADAIVTELRLALDHERGAPVSHELERLYLFVEERIGRALGSRSREAIDEARGVLAVLLEAWAELDVAELQRG
jgi:flagellar protein FliS